MMTLPANLMLGSSERKQIEAHAGALHAALTRTPATSADAEAETLVLVTKLMLAKPGMRSSEAGAEATGEAYQAALEDLPPWAVAAAIRRWHRGDCHDMLDKERPNYDFRPSTAKLRAVAFAEASKVRGRVIELERVLAAVPRIEYSPEHRAEMRARLAAASPILRAIVHSPEAVIAENRMREAERLGRLADRRAAEAAE
jgi:hypothetical protein